MDSKIDQKSIKNRSENRCIISMHLGIDFWSILVCFGPQDGPQNRPKIDEKSILGAHGDPKAAQDPPKTLPRPPKTENLPQIDPKSVQNPPNIDPTSTQHLLRIYMQKLLKINHNRPRMQAYKDTSVQGQSDIRGFGPTCYTAPPNFRTPVNKGAGGRGEALRYWFFLQRRFNFDNFANLFSSSD